MVRGEGRMNSRHRGDSEGGQLACGGETHEWHTDEMYNESLLEIKI